MKTLKTTLGLLVMLGSLLVSCESNTYEEIAGVVPNPTYNANVKPIMEDKCNQCHNPDYGQEPYLQTYAMVKDACENGNVLCRIAGSSCGTVMPSSGKMPKARIDIILNWADQNYPEN
jgi:predicted CXXCH cytochrome family protein